MFNRWMTRILHTSGTRYAASNSTYNVAMKIYTRTGDDGSTGLLSGQRTRKNDLRLDCYGTIDELSAAIGLAVVVSEPDLNVMLRQVQNELLVIGSHVAAAGEQPPANL